MKKALRRPFALALFVSMVAVLLIADRFTKILAVEHLSDAGSIPFIPGILDFTLVYNEGVAFGLFTGANLVFVVVALLVSLSVITYLLYGRSHKLIEVVSLGLIVAGALGNLVDRIRISAVIDFIRTTFVEFPVFNIADSCVTIGCLMLMLYIIVLTRKNTKSGSKKNTEPDSLEEGS